MSSKFAAEKIDIIVIRGSFMPLERDYRAKRRHYRRQTMNYDNGSVKEVSSSVSSDPQPRGKKRGIPEREAF